MGTRLALDRSIKRNWQVYEEAGLLRNRFFFTDEILLRRQGFLESFLMQQAGLSVMF